MNSSQQKSNKHEKKRVQELLSYQIMDTPPEIELDEITKMAYMICETPISLISLLDDSRQWFKSNHGLKCSQTTKDISFCQYAIQQPDLFMVEDSLLDDRFKNNPLVLGDPFIRFYAGMPLVTPSSYRIGTLCVIDRKPKKLTENQIFILKALAKQVITNFELRKRYKELFNLNEKNQKLSKLKEEFFSNMSHELRTPLNAIAGFTENLYKSKLDPQQKEQLCIIKSSVDILISIVNDILDYSKIDSGSLKIEKHPFNLRALIKTTYELMKMKAQGKSILLISNLSKEIPTYLKGDKIRLNQILVNLMGNAIKFTREGTVTLSIDQRSSTNEEVELTISVKDTGIGIPSDHLKEIFDRFSQVEGTTRIYGGSGLGLSISKSLVELQKGSLDVKSELGKGTEFSFSIKYGRASQEEILLLEEAERNDECCFQQNFKNVRVLLAEDNAINVKLIKQLFEGTGIHLETSDNGKVCIEKLKKGNYDIILMDLFMPEMDGYEATKYIRNTLNLDIPIVGLSASNSENVKEKSYEVGMNEYLTKPFKIKELLETISRITKTANSKKQQNKINPNSIKENKINNLYKYKTINAKEYNPKYLPLVLSKEKIFKLKFKKQKFLKKYNSKFIPASKITFENAKSTSFLPPSNQRKVYNFLQGENLSQTINFKILKEYSGNDEEFEKELIDVFLYEMPKYLKELEVEINKEDFLEIKKAAHKIKSPLGMFGLSALKNKFEKIENFSDKLQIIPIISLFVNCKNCLEKISRELIIHRETTY